MSEQHMTIQSTGGPGTSKTKELGAGLSSMSEKIRKDYEQVKAKLVQLEIENDQMAKQIEEKQREIQDLESEFQRIKEEGEEGAKKFHSEYSELQHIVKSSMSDM